MNNMELEVGMYVRTKHHGILKYGDRFLFDDDILKASHNIIDLIEAGDYVNGERVCAVEKYEEGKFTVLALFEDYCTQQNIKSIVTKEQFESMRYEVSK